LQGGQNQRNLEGLPKPIDRTWTGKILSYRKKLTSQKYPDSGKEKDGNRSGAGSGDGGEEGKKVALTEQVLGQTEKKKTQKGRKRKNGEGRLQAKAMWVRSGMKPEFHKPEREEEYPMRESGSHP